MFRRDTAITVLSCALVFVTLAGLASPLADAEGPPGGGAAGPGSSIDTTTDDDAGSTTERSAPPEDAFYLLYQLPAAVSADVFVSVGRQHRQRLGCDDRVLPIAKALYLDEDYAGVADLLGRLAETCAGPRDDRERFLLANAYFQLGRYSDALDSLSTEDDRHIVPDYVQMLRAASLRALGRPAEAVPSYDAVAAERRGPRYHEARVERATALFEAGELSAAVKALTSVLEDYSEYPMRERLYLMRGRAQLALGKTRAAADDLETTVFNWPWKSAATEAEELLEQVAAEGVKVRTRSYDERYERAQSLRVNKHWGLAEAAFRGLLAEVATADGVSTEENKLQLQLALNYYGASRYDDALPLLERLADLHERRKGNGTSRDTVFTTIVRCHEYAGRPDEALEAVHRRDQKHGEAVRTRRLAEFFEDNGQYDKAIRYWEQALKSRTPATWHYAFLQYKVGRYAPAIRTLKDLTRRASGTTRAQYMYWTARALEKKGDLRQAYELFGEVAERYERDYYGYQATNRRIELQHVFDATSNAVASDGAGEPSRTLTRDGETAASGSENARGVGADSVVASSVVHPALQRFAQLGATPEAPLQGEREVALVRSPAKTETAVVDLAAEQAVVPTARAQYFWGNPPFTMPHFDAAGQESNVSVEGLRAPYLGAYVGGESVEGAMAQAAERWGDLFPRLRRASFLFDVGLETEARWELRDVSLELRGLAKFARGGRRPKANKPWALGFYVDRHYIDNRREPTGYWGVRSKERRYPVPGTQAGKQALAERQRAIADAGDALFEDLVKALKEGGDFHLVRRFAHDESFTKTDPLTGSKRDLWSEAFPRAFPRLVQKNAALYGLNPYLMWALMTVESTYNPDSVSVADARGLLQVIPKTGIKVATSLGVDAYGPHDLLDERMSIRFGTWYFAQLVNKFHGQELFAIAGYNGGPHNVARWVTQRGSSLEMDEFVETIPFDQARNYAKKVTRFAGLYQRIYESNPVLYIGNAVEPVFRVDPNY